MAVKAGCSPHAPWTKDAQRSEFGVGCVSGRSRAPFGQRTPNGPERRSFKQPPDNGRARLGFAGVIHPSSSDFGAGADCGGLQRSPTDAPDLQLRQVALAVLVVSASDRAPVAPQQHRVVLSTSHLGVGHPRLQLGQVALALRRTLCQLWRFSAECRRRPKFGKLWCGRLVFNRGICRWFWGSWGGGVRTYHLCAICGGKSRSTRHAPRGANR